jgi:replicative DNA helicase
MDKLVVALLDRVNELAENGAEDVTGVRTGFYDLDRMTAGLQKGDLIVLAARPSMGKTAFALNIAEHVAVNEGLPVLVFSMEMGASQLALRMVGSLGRIDQQHLRTGKLTTTTGAPGRGRGPAQRRSIFIDETPALNSVELRAARGAWRASRRHAGPDRHRLPAADERLVGNGREPRHRDRRDLARPEGAGQGTAVPGDRAVAAQPLVETRTDKRPMMSDLRESGAIEQDADVIMFIYRDEYYNKDSQQGPGVAEIIIGKQRQRPGGHREAAPRRSPGG